MYQKDSYRRTNYTFPCHQRKEAFTQKLTFGNKIYIHFIHNKLVFKYIEINNEKIFWYKY